MGGCGEGETEFRHRMSASVLSVNFVEVEL